MKPAEIREKTDAELEELEKTLSRDLFKSRFANYSNQLDDTDKLRRLRQDVVRVKTVRNERARDSAKK